MGNRVWASALVGLMLAGLAISCSGQPQIVSKSREERLAEAQRLRDGMPKPASTPLEPREAAVVPVRQAPVETVEATHVPAEPTAEVTDEGKTKRSRERRRRRGKERRSRRSRRAAAIDLMADVETLPGLTDGAEAMLSPLPSSGDPQALVLGEFPLLREKAILDGDTVKVEGLDASLRLLGIDTEETFKKKKHRAMAAEDFVAYTKYVRGDKPKPAKYGTPSGEEAKVWAEEFFAGYDVVRLEFDELGRQKGVFGRYLVYVFVRRGDQWVNYNVECVRAGMAPYFMKYGYSRRFHKEFVDAQREAQAAQRGIWSPHVEHYPDYPERLVWWTRRANALVRFERLHQSDPDYFQLGLDTEWERMGDRVGDTVTMFGTFGESKLDESPYRLNLSHKRFEDFTIVAFDKADIDALSYQHLDGEYVYVRGKLSEYKGKYQFKANTIERIWTE